MKFFLADVSVRGLHCFLKCLEKFLEEKSLMVNKYMKVSPFSETALPVKDWGLEKESDYGMLALYLYSALNICSWTLVKLGGSLI